MLALRARPVQQPAHGRQVPPVPSGTYSATGATECLVCGLRDVSQRTMETADGDVGSTLPYGIDCEDGVVGAVDANGSVTGVLPGHWAGAPLDETQP